MVGEVSMLALPGTASRHSEDGRHHHAASDSGSKVCCALHACILPCVLMGFTVLTLALPQLHWVSAMPIKAFAILVSGSTHPKVMPSRPWYLSYRPCPSTSASHCALQTRQRQKWLLLQGCMCVL